MDIGLIRIYPCMDTVFATPCVLYSLHNYAAAVFNSTPFSTHLESYNGITSTTLKMVNHNVTLKVVLLILFLVTKHRACMLNTNTF